MYTGNPDILSLLLYLLLGAFSALIINAAMNAEKGYLIDPGRLEHINNPKVKRLAELTRAQRIACKLSLHRIDRRFLLLSSFVLLFTFFASARKVDISLGGADALNYAKIFYYSNLDNSPYAYLVKEPLFVFVCRVVRVFTDDYRVFFALAYAFIAASYCFFINKFFPHNGSCIPFVMLAFLYLKAFCTLRTSLAVAVILIGLALFDKNKLASFLWIASSFFIHRASVFFVLVFFFCMFCHKYAVRLKGKRLAIAVTAINLVLILLARGAQLVIDLTDAFGLLSKTDLYYVTHTLETPLIMRFPMYAAQTLLFVAIVILEPLQKQSKAFCFVKTVCVFDFLLAPVMLIMGVWRANEYFYVARLIMWSMLIPQGEALFTRITKGRIKARWYRIALCLAFFAWLGFRILSEWDDLRIMPYLFNFFVKGE